MRPQIIIITLLLAITLIPTSHASTATFSDNNLIGNDYLLYDVTSGTQAIATLNGSSTNVSLPDSHQLLLVIRPSSTDGLKNPDLLPGWTLNLVGPFAGLLVVCILAGVLIYFMRR